MIKTAIAGASGYTGGELIRILINHPDIELKWLTSTSLIGEKVSSVHKDLIGECNLEFCEEPGDPNLLFLALGHGVSREYLSRHTLPSSCKIVDLGSDFRLNGTFGAYDFIYGITELFHDKILNSNAVANPGCFATGIILALAPLAASRLLKSEVHIHAITGSTGAGRELTQASHFSNRDSNVSVYKPFEHRHLAEIKMSIERLSGTDAPHINIIPMRGAFTRGIFSSIYTELDEKIDIESIKTLYNKFYIDSPFVFITDESLNLKEVVNTNRVLLRLERFGKYLYITSIIDNLLKGASGQAVQNMNLMFGLPQERGLKFKATVY